jgi:hypothetical protein
MKELKLRKLIAENAEISWDYVSILNLSEDFIREFKDKLFWRDICVKSFQ